MIVPMKRVWLVTLQEEKQDTLAGLGKLGVIHLDVEKPESPQLEELRLKKELLEKALGLLPRARKPGLGRKIQHDTGRALELAGEITGLEQKRETLTQELVKRRQEIERQRVWGDFDPGLVNALAGAGIGLKLYQLSDKEIKDIPAGVDYFVVKREKHERFICCISLEGERELPFKLHQIPSLRLRELETKIAHLKKEMAAIKDAIARYAGYHEILQGGRDAVMDQITFWEAEACMTGSEKLVYLSGFVPEPAIVDLKKAAGANGWALLIQEPKENEDVPTLVKNNRFISIIRPVFAFLGTVPGYREKEISPFFLFFFSIFYGMLIGDAAYGCLFLLFSLALYALGPRSARQITGLLIVTSLTTIGWGAITGTWFNISREVILSTPPFSWLAVPALISTPKNDTTALLMHICFIIGAVHLSIAHLWNIISKFPKPKFLADVGWISIIWGGYFIIRYLVLKYPLFEWAPHLFIGGFVLVLLTSEQEGKFFKGMLMGLAKLPLTFLSSISALADVISYVRLFAVGLASVKVEEAFNTMAMGFGFSFPGVIGLVVVLLLGHSLNIVLGVMSVIVHGIRLNMLEFSGHLGLEWAGREYKPFKLRPSPVGNK